MIVIALISLFTWVGLVFARGWFWLCDQRLPPSPIPPDWPKVSVLIPARDEADTIRAVISAHMQSNYPGALDIFLVDDGSTDGTPEEARAGAAGQERALHIIGAPPLATGWSGKLWAVNAGLDAIAATAPDTHYILMSDADIRHAPDLATKLVAFAEYERTALTSVMARLDDRGVWGGLLIPAFIFFFQKLYPFRLTNRLRSKVAGAAGGVMLVRRDALTEIGGVETFRDTLIDDCALARAIKKGPPKRPIALFLADGAAEAKSLRDNRSFSSIQNMVARTAFTQLDYSAWKLAGALIGMGLIYLAGPGIVLTAPVHGDMVAAGLGLCVWALMLVTYAPTLTLYGRSPWQGVFLPFAAALYTGFTCLSAWRYWQGAGGAWKGRTYAGANSGINPSSAIQSSAVSKADASEPGSNPSS